MEQTPPGLYRAPELPALEKEINEMSHCTAPLLWLTIFFRKDGTSSCVEPMDIINIHFWMETTDFSLIYWTPVTGCQLCGSGLPLFALLTFLPFSVFCSLSPPPISSQTLAVLCPSLALFHTSCGWAHHMQPTPPIGSEFLIGLSLTSSAPSRLVSWSPMVIWLLVWDLCCPLGL